MPCCCVKNCKNRSETSAKYKNGISFHLFPRNQAKREKWINAIGRANWSPTSATVVCSKHFTENSFYKTKSGLIRLLEDAVPRFHAINDEVALQLQEKGTSDKRNALTDENNEAKLTIEHFPVLKVPILDGNSTEKDKVLAAHIKRMQFMCKRQRKAIREVQRVVQIQKNVLASIYFQPFLVKGKRSSCKKEYPDMT